MFGRNRQESVRRRRPGESGLALIVVITFMFITFLALTASFDVIHQALVMEESSDRIASGSDGVDRALGIAIARLHSGVPAMSPYECRLRLRSTDGSTMIPYKITHTQLDSDSWTVKAEPSSATLDDCPASFETECALVVP
jgi:hypothetical protein